MPANLVYMQPAMLLEVRRGVTPSGQPNWVLLQSVTSFEEAEKIASGICDKLDCRLYVGPESGYYYGDFIDDETDPEACIFVFLPA